MTDHPFFRGRHSGRLILLVILVATFLRLYGLGVKQLWVDEIIQVISASPDSISEILSMVKESKGAVPLDYLIQHIIITIFGRFEFTVRIHAAIFGILAILVLYFLVEYLFDRRTALVCSFLYALYPLHHHYSQEARPYSFFVLLTLLSYYLFLKMLKENKNVYFVLYMLSFLLMIYTYYFGFLVVFTHCVYLLLSRKYSTDDGERVNGRIDGRFALKYAATLLIPFLLLLPWVVYSFENTQGLTPEQFGASLILRVIKELGNGSYPLAAVLILLAVAGYVYLKKQREAAHAALLLTWLLVPVPIIFLLIWARDYFFAIRQLLFVTPALYILVTLGIFFISERQQGSFKPTRVTVFLVSLVALISLTIIILHYPDKRDDFRSAAAFLERNVSAEDAIVCPEVTGILSYYYESVYARERKISQVLDVSGGAESGKLYIISTRYMKEEDKRRMDDLLQGIRPIRTVEFRGITIYVISPS
ncbi:MAG: glycosyltransferase family 39 protein [Acidobacteria bacterium]|nr:glycosyltransferase family 39 protein [Acidobacteriota bacterium]